MCLRTNPLLWYEDMLLPSNEASLAVGGTHKERERGFSCGVFEDGCAKSATPCISREKRY